MFTRRGFINTSAAGLLAGTAVLSPTKLGDAEIKSTSREELRKVSKSLSLPFNIFEKINPDLSDALFQILGTEIENRLIVNRFLENAQVDSTEQLSPEEHEALLVDLCHYRAVADCLPIILALGCATREISNHINPKLIPEAWSEQKKQGIIAANTFTAQSVLFMTYFTTLLTSTRSLYVDELKSHTEYQNNPNRIPLSKRLKLCWSNKGMIFNGLLQQSGKLAMLPVDLGKRFSKGQINTYIDLMMNLAGYILSTQNISKGRFVLNIPRSAAINRGLVAQYQGDVTGKRKLNANCAANSITWTFLFGSSALAQPIAKFFNLTPQGSSPSGTINIKQFMGDFLRTLFQLTAKKEAVVLLRKWFDENLSGENKSILWSYVEPS